MPAPGAGFNNGVLSGRGHCSCDRHIHTNGERFQRFKQMTASVNGIITLVGNTQTMRLVDFDVVRHHVRNVFNVSIVDRFVISGVERHWLKF
ncbi:Uncharacterised protein [Enterobacter hormaechei]|nr:Uncharacterised protein [Enterobacter hormaechei]CZZ13735.1 Uncharacterised protein [Enterobacter hormaechei]